MTPCGQSGQSTCMAASLALALLCCLSSPLHGDSTSWLCHPVPEVVLAGWRPIDTLRAADGECQVTQVQIRAPPLLCDTDHGLDFPEPQLPHGDRASGLGVAE